MRMPEIIKLAGLLMAVLFGSSVQAADTPATIPTALLGTYDLTYAAESSNGPFANGTKVAVVLMANNQLCVNGTVISSPVIRNNNAHEAIWIDAAGKFEYAVSSLVTGFNEVNISEGVLFTSSFKFHGQLRGSRTSTATTCTGSSGSGTTTVPTITSDVQSIFDLAAQVYPSLLVNGSALGQYQGYVYKFFAASGIYVGIKDNKIFTMGGPFGTGIKEQGSVTAVLGALQTAKTKIDANKPITSTTPVTPTLPTGLYKLTLSGTYRTSGIVSISVPLNITINDLPAPSVSDTTVIVDQVKTQLGASGISNIRVTSINNTASRVTFRVEFSATVAAVGNVSYDLTYDYTR